MQGLYVTYRRARDSSAMAIPLQGVTTGKRASEIHRLLHKYKRKRLLQGEGHLQYTDRYIHAKWATTMKEATEVNRLVHKYKKKGDYKEKAKWNTDGKTCAKERSYKKPNIWNSKNLVDRQYTKTESSHRDTEAHLVWKAVCWEELGVTGLERWAVELADVGWGRMAGGTDRVSRQGWTLVGTGRWFREQVTHPHAGLV